MNLVTVTSDNYLLHTVQLIESYNKQVDKKNIYDAVLESGYFSHILMHSKLNMVDIHQPNFLKTFRIDRNYENCQN